MRKYEITVHTESGYPFTCACKSPADAYAAIHEACTMIDGIFDVGDQDRTIVALGKAHETGEAAHFSVAHKSVFVDIDSVAGSERFSPSLPPNATTQRSDTA